MYPIKPMYPKHSLLSKVTDCWTTNQLGFCGSFPCHRTELADIVCRWLQLWTKMVATTMMTSISGAQGKSLSLPHPWAGYYCSSEIYASHLWLQYLSPHLLYYFTDIVHYFYPFLCSGWDLKRQIIVVDSLSTTGYWSVWSFLRLRLCKDLQPGGWLLAVLVLQVDAHGWDSASSCYVICNR
jgi:hypothetical protein